MKLVPPESDINSWSRDINKISCSKKNAKSKFKIYNKHLNVTSTGTGGDPKKMANVKWIEYHTPF